jgi:hypothetical protein
MANITTLDTVDVTITLPGTYPINYFHLEIIDPSNSHNWKEGTEVTYTSVENTVAGTTTTTISTTVDLPVVGRWRVVIYKGTAGYSYTRVGSTSIQKVENTTEVVI